MLGGTDGAAALIGGATATAAACAPVVVPAAQGTLSAIGQALNPGVTPAPPGSNTASGGSGANRGSR